MHKYVHMLMKYAIALCCGTTEKPKRSVRSIVLVNVSRSAVQTQSGTLAGPIMHIERQTLSRTQLHARQIAVVKLLNLRFDV